MRLRGLNPDEHLASIHGKRAIDSLARLLPGCDPYAENAVLRVIECEESADVRPFAGVQEFLASLPPERWAIVTSGTEDVAMSRIRASGIPIPGKLVTAEWVQNGKPHPDPFLCGAAQLGIEPSRCLAFEDTAAGVVSARTAGCVVAGVTCEIDADLVVEDWNALRAESSQIGIKICGFSRTRL